MPYFARNNQTDNMAGINRAKNQVGGTRKPHTMTLNIQIADAAKDVAALMGMSFSHLVEEALREIVKHHGVDPRTPEEALRKRILEQVGGSLRRKHG